MCSKWIVPMLVTDAKPNNLYRIEDLTKANCEITQTQILTRYRYPAATGELPINFALIRQVEHYKAAYQIIDMIVNIRK